MCNSTNWLEALRLIAKVKPDLYEEIFNYSYNHFNETQKFYHITPNLNNITPLQNIEYKDYYTHLNNDKYIMKGNFFNMNDKKQQTKWVLVVLCCIVYSVTNLYEHFNLWFLMLLAIVAGTYYVLFTNVIYL